MISEAACKSCPLNWLDPASPNRTHRPITQQIPQHPRLALFVEQPGPTELKDNRLLTLYQRKLLQKCFSDYLVNLDSCVITAPLLCASTKPLPPKVRAEALNACSVHWKEALATYGGQTILAFGGEPLKLLTGNSPLSKWAGVPLKCTMFDRHAVGIPHPKQATKQDDILPVIDAYVRKALMYTPTEWQWPKIVTSFDGEAAVDEALLLLRSSQGLLAIDTETAGLSYKAELKDIALADNRVSLCVQLKHLTSTQREAVRDLCAGPRPKVLHNALFDMMVLKHNGFSLENVRDDTMIAFTVLYPGLKKDLGFVASLLTNAPRFKSDFRAASKDPWKSDEKAEMRAHYCAKDAYTTWYLMVYCLGVQFIPELSLAIEYRDLMDEVQIAFRMRQRGVFIDQDQKTKLTVEVGQETQRLASALAQATSALGLTDFNPSSSKQVAKLFQEILGLKSHSKTASGASAFGADEVLKLCEHEREEVREVARLLAAYRRMSKLYGTYLKELDQYIDDDGRIRPSWNPAGTITRRWTCSNPNLQQVAKSR